MENNGLGRAVVVLAHPYNRSYGACTANAVLDGFKKAGKHVDFIDLHADGFNPVVSKEEAELILVGEAKDELVKKYVKLIKEANELVVVYPDWWSQAPAIYRGFVEKVLTNKEFREKQANGQWKGKASWIKRVQIYSTSFTPDLYAKYMMWNAHKNGVKHVFKVLGMKGIEKHHTDRVRTRKREDKEQRLIKATEHTASGVIRGGN